MKNRLKSAAPVTKVNFALKITTTIFLPNLVFIYRAIVEVSLHVLYTSRLIAFLHPPSETDSLLQWID